MNIIKKLIEEIIQEDNTAFITSASGKTTAISYKDKKELDSIKPNSDVKKIETSSGQKLKEMARTSEVFYKLKPNYLEDIEGLKNKLSKSEMRTLIDVVKVLKDENRPMDAQELMQVHNEKNPDRQYKSQQGFIRPLVITAIQKGKINYGDLPFTSSQEDRRQGFEKTYNIPSKSVKFADKFSREKEDVTKDKVYKDKLIDIQKELLNNTVKYKSLREKYFTYKNKTDSEAKHELNVVIKRMNELLDIKLAVSLLYQWKEGYLNNVLDQPLKDFSRNNNLLVGSNIEGLTPQFEAALKILLDNNYINNIGKTPYIDKGNKKNKFQTQNNDMKKPIMTDKDIEDYYKSIGMDPDADSERKTIYVGDTNDLEKGLYNNDWNFDDEEI